MKKSFASILFLFLLFAIGCEKLAFDKDPENKPVKNFDLLWETIDKKYSLFEYKKVNWDSVYEVYRPQVNNEMTDEALFQVMDDMLFTLRDGHVNLSSPFNVARNWQWYLNHPENFDWPLIEREYLGPAHRITGPFRNVILPQNVGYVYYGSFGGQVKDIHLHHLLKHMESTKGLIFDIRNNGGGSTINAQKIVSRFADQTRVVSRAYYKNGPEHYDFTGPQVETIGPSDQMQYTQPVIVLTNRSSFSAANDFASWMKVFPHIRTLGDTTGGGGGIPISGELLNGWTYRFSSTKTIAPNGYNIEGGVPPDLFKEMDQQDITQGVDPLIEEAVGEVK